MTDAAETKKRPPDFKEFLLGEGPNLDGIDLSRERSAMRETPNDETGAAMDEVRERAEFKLFPGFSSPFSISR